MSGPGALRGWRLRSQGLARAELDQRCGAAQDEHAVAERGEAAWKTLIGAGLTRSEGLTMGVARLPHGGSLHTHRHEQHEVYFVLDGAAVVTIEGTARTVGPGVAVFIPGNAVHSVQATGDSALRFAYVFAADSFQEVE